MKKSILVILKKCQANKLCDDCPGSLAGRCLLQNVNFPRGIDIRLFQLSKTEREVIEAIELRNSSKICTKEGCYTKRHANAIDSLKKKKIIRKNSDNLLELI